MADHNDPLISALIAKLPAAGGRYSQAQRVNWLRMMVMAFNEAYGIETSISVCGLEDEPPRNVASGGLGLRPGDDVVPPARPPKPVDDRYRIDAEGFALRGDTPIDPQDVPPGTAIIDERTGHDHLDPATILWKTGGAIEQSKLPYLNLRGADHG
jgi:hypothetical protein